MNTTERVRRFIDESDGALPPPIVVALLDLAAEVDALRVGMQVHLKDCPHIQAPVAKPRFW